MLARRFLWVIAGLVLLLLAGALAYRLFEQRLLKLAMVPSVTFEEAAAPAGPDYADATLWIARPDIPNNPALWAPRDYGPDPTPAASVFFIHPTSFLERSRWNAPIDDAESQQRARLFVRSQASAFNGVGAIWAPKYRQATFGAFLTTKEDAQKALDFAYRDVSASFDAFLRQAPADRPIILAAHSQGSLHLMRLLADKVAGKPIARRIAAAYVVGWPISVSADLPSLGLPACQAPEQFGCILSWQSFAEPADPSMVTDVYDASRNEKGVSRSGSPMLCTNPLTGGAAKEASLIANFGTLIPNKELTDAEVVIPGIGARCDIRGFLLIGENPPDLGPYVLPGNNYHVYDYALFWPNVRADARKRVEAFLAR